MDFEMNADQTRTAYGKWLSLEKSNDNYITQVYEDTDSSCGYLPMSDVVFMFERKSGQMCAAIERVNKKDFSIFGRIHLYFHGKRVVKNTEIGIEGFVYDRGDYIEYQFYRRWWYDIAKNGGMLSDVSNTPTNH